MICMCVVDAQVRVGLKSQTGTFVLDSGLGLPATAFRVSVAYLFCLPISDFLDRLDNQRNTTPLFPYLIRI